MSPASVPSIPQSGDVRHVETVIRGAQRVAWFDSRTGLGLTGVTLSVVSAEGVSTGEPAIFLAHNVIPLDCIETVITALRELRDQIENEEQNA